MMKLRRGEKWLLAFTLAYIIAFAIYYISIGNYEFAGYLTIILFFVILVGATIRKTNFDYVVLWGLSIWGLLHMAGGGVVINGGVLYVLEVVHLFDVGDTYVIKMDQLIHAFGFGITAIAAYQLLRPRAKMGLGLIYGLAFFIAMGAGALNELIEFFIAVSVPDNGVGGYFNNGLDLVFNGIGSLIALLFVHWKYEK